MRILEKNEKLKPCPFCGGKVGYNYNIELKPDGIHCLNCKMIVRFSGIKMNPKETYGELQARFAEKWNRRAEK